MEAGQLVPDEVTIGMAEDRMDSRTRRAASCSTASRATSRRPRRWTTSCEARRPEAGRRAGPGGPGGRGGQAHRRPPHLPQRQQPRFHVEYRQPKTEGVCDVCGGELYQREDDSEETVRKRLEVYHSETEPIIDYYKAQGLVVTISALGKVGEVTQRAMARSGASKAA